jgi:flavorubredoxin
MIKTLKLNEVTTLVSKVDDRDVPFHRLVLAKGTTYNSYLLQTEKPTVIDTVDMSFGREYADAIAELIDPLTIQYIVINHTEPDHSGGLAALAMRATNATIVCTALAKPELQEMYKLFNRDFLVIEDGDTLDIGGRTLLFKETPYLHTAETMITYSVEDKTLFPCDIFSTHVATYDFFNDVVGDISEDFSGYYQAIIHPHRRYVKTLIDATNELDIQVIAPSHGFVLRTDAQKYIDLYEEWSKNTQQGKKATIVYSTIKNNTKKIAAAIETQLLADGIQVETFNVDKVDHAEILASIQAADAIFVGTSTKYADMIGSLEEVLKAMLTLDLTGKTAVAFGSYGWSGEAIEVIQDYLNQTQMNTLSTSNVIKSTGMTHVEFPIRIRFAPKTEERKQTISDATTFVSDLLLNGLA